MRLSHIEKRVIVSAGVLACVIGVFAGYGALSRLLEDQFHGGVLAQDRTSVMWWNAFHAVAAFAKAGVIAWIALGLVPVLLHRVFSSASR